MKKYSLVFLLVCVLVLYPLIAFGSDTATVSWNMDSFSAGELRVDLKGFDDGLWVVLAVYSENSLTKLATADVENASASLTVQISENDGCAKLMLFNRNTLSPAAAVLSAITPSGVSYWGASPEPKTGTIAGTVWLDEDGNGIIGEAEALRLGGVAITIKNADETYTDQTETDENGGFTFENVVIGDYTITTSIPDDMESTTAATAAVTVERDEVSTVNFGFKEIIKTGTIAGTVWLDEDGDGVIGETEALRLGGVAITIKNADETYTDQTETDENGGFTFENVVIGEYTLTAGTPEDMEPTTATTSTVIVASDEVSTVNFGFKEIIKTGAIAGTVWLDEDGDSIIGEAEASRLGGVAITIKNTDETYTDQTETDENGGFTFENVVIGEYTLTAGTPEDMEPTTADTSTVTVAKDEVSTVNFGFKEIIKTGAIAGTVWLDEDGDGVIGEAETSRLGGVAITIKNADETYTDQTETDENGGFTFENVVIGDYTITASIPDDMEPTTATTSTVTVERDEVSTVNFGFKEIIKTGTIAGTVWLDEDGDGIIGEAEASRLGGVAITIKSSDEIYTDQTETDENGGFTFENVVIGDYTLTAETPEDMEPTTADTSTVIVASDEVSTVNFGFRQVEAEPEPEKWVSDNQLVNNSHSVGYHSFEPLKGEYLVSFRLTRVSKGDDAVLLGDSANGGLDYAKSSAILLFNGDYFATRGGNGSGSYNTEAANLCPAEVGKNYLVTFEGDVRKNTYTVSVTDEAGKIFTASGIHARTNAAALNTLGLINNSHNTTVNPDGSYSGYRFYITDFSAEAIVDDPVYSGFAGRYYAIKAGGKYVRGNSGSLSADYDSPKDDSAEFLPRIMGDGSLALMCRSSKRRFTAQNSGERLASAEYDFNSDVQHWIFEESENYSPDHLSYYLKSLYNGLYIGLSGCYLTAAEQSERTELVFEALNDRSPLYLISQTSAYALLNREQRKRLEEVYESVAGDVFDRYSSDILNSEWTARLRMDNIFNNYLSGKLSDDELYNKLRDFLSKTDGFLIRDNEISNNYILSPNLPGTQGLSVRTDEGVYGEYDFWRGTVLKGTKYLFSIYNADGSLQHQFNFYVADDGTARQNAEAFKEAIIKIPYAYRKYIHSVKVRNDNANSFNCGASDLYIRLNWSMGSEQMRGTLMHELNHSVDQSNGHWSSGEPWKTAMADDMFMVSPYANSSTDEDFAEFGRLYSLCYGNKDRQRAIQLMFPNRYASYYRLRANGLGGFSLWDDEEYPAEKPI